MKHPPKTHILESMAAAKLSWKHVFGEWIDNALDAQATTIAIVVDGKKVLSVTDNGAGCSNPLVMVIPGDRISQKYTQLGRYGIGGKDSALWVGDMDSVCQIKTVHAGRLATLQINWRNYEQNDWEIDDPDFSTPEPDERGTRIRITPVIRKLPEGQAFAQLLSDLGYMYSPAIKRGAQISFQVGTKKMPQLLERWKLPPFREGETIDSHLEIQGKKVRVYCGIVKPGEPNPRMGLTYLYGYRVILPASSSGCDGYNVSQICGFVELDDSWRLTKNKDEIRDADMLFDAVQQCILPVLQRAEQLGTLYASAVFENELTSKLQGLLRNPAKTQKAKREPKEKDSEQGTIEPVNSGRKHRTARKTQPGDRFSAKDAGSIRLVFGNLGNSAIGTVRYPTVTLNTNNKWISKIETTHNSDAALMAALSLINAERFFKTEKQFMLPLNCTATENSEDYSRSLGEIIDGIPMLMPEETQ